MKVRLQGATTARARFTLLDPEGSAVPISPDTATLTADSPGNVLHTMERGAAPPGGEWPAGWLPVLLGGPVQSRSPVS